MAHQHTAEKIMRKFGKQTLFVVISLALIVAAIILVKHFPSDRKHFAPGRIEGSGKSFMLKNSKYINLKLESSEKIQTVIESVPAMVRISIFPIVSKTAMAKSSKITLRGFKPLTAYYKYQDDYHNLVKFVTDEKGNYKYIQDISVPHLVFIQSEKNTLFIKNDAAGGDCTKIGMWDIPTKTCALTTDVNETIQIDNDGITINGNGHTLSGSDTGSGIFMSSRSNVVIKNLKITHFFDGVTLYKSNSATINGNTLLQNVYGVRVGGGSNKIINNTFETNGIFGVYLDGGYALNNLISGNALKGEDYAVYVYFGGIGNVVSNNKITLSNLNGITVLYTPVIEIAGNEISGTDVNKNKYAGIYIGRRTSDTVFNIAVRENTISKNGSYGIALDTYPIALTGLEKILVYRNTISDNGIYGVNSAYATELSYNNEGNTWGHDAPPCFREGDSNDITTVVDSHPVCIAPPAPVDTTPPVITINEIPKEVLLNSSVTFGFSVTDDMSGVKSVNSVFDSAPITNGETKQMTTVGEHKFKVEAVDNAGNSRTAEVIFNVVYGFGKFLSPLRMDRIGLYHEKRTIPVKFQLTDSTGKIINTAQVRLFMANVVNGTVGQEQAAVCEPEKRNAASDNPMRAKENYYTCHLDTLKLASGTWQLRAVLDDGKSYTVLITLRQKKNDRERFDDD